MDGNGLISFLEGIRHDIPAPLQSEFDDTVKLIRNIVDTLEQVVAPPAVMQSGKQRLQTHHSALLDHASTLQSALADFQGVYTGPGSEAYHQAANHSLQQLNLLTDHLAFAIGAHDAIASNLEDALLAMTALELILAAFIATTFLLPEGVPGWAAEGVGGGMSLASFATAMASVSSTLLSLAEAALPWVVWGLAALVAVTWLSSDAPAHPAQQTHPATVTIPADWADQGSIAKWRDKIMQKLQERGLKGAELQRALATAAAIARALACAGLSQAEIDNLMSQFGNLYNVKWWVNQPRNSFWYSIALLMSVASGGQIIIPGMSFKNVKESDITNARRIVRALIDPEGTDGNGTPISPAAITGGPGNVQTYEEPIYKNRLTGKTVIQSQYNNLPPQDQSQYDTKEQAGRVDIVTKDGKYIEVGGADKGNTTAFQMQLRNLANAVGENATYTVLEQPPAGSPQSTWTNFDRAVAAAKEVLPPDHIIILNSGSDACTIS
jgi:hypothetical protein